MSYSFDAHRWMKKIIYLVVFVLIVSFSFLARKYDFTRESARFFSFVPFTLESAIMYSYSWEIAKSGSVPKYDSSIISSKNIPIDAQMSLTMEYFLGYGYRVFHMLDNNSKDYTITDSNYNINNNFISFIRNQIVLWISLSAGLIFLLLLLLDCSFLYSFLGGILFAITPAAIMRATGQDLIKENFAIVPIILTFLLYFLYLKKPTIIRAVILFLSSFLSIISWDMVQLFFSVWVVFEIITALFRDTKEWRYLFSWVLIYLALITGGIFDPYLNAHSFLYSPLNAILIPLLILILCFRGTSKISRLLVFVVICVALSSLWFFILRNIGYWGNYSHFWSLLLAKIDYLNIKPLNPLLLDFDARILWTPALNSANYTILWNVFHLLVPFFFIILLAYFSSSKFKKLRFKDGYAIYLSVYMALVFFILFIFMVRFHSLAIPFISLAVILLWQKILEGIKNTWMKRALSSLLIILVLSEGLSMFSYQRVYNEDISSQLKLIKELNEYNVSGKVFLADFTLSSMLKAYCGAKIVLIPKFELKSERDNVKKFINIIFHGTESELMNFSRANNVDYYIFDQGMIGGNDTEQVLDPYTSRYMAAANTLDKNSPVYRFFYAPSSGRYFYPIDTQTDSRYVIFKVIYPQDMIDAFKLNKTGEKLLISGDKNNATYYFSEAVQKDPYYEKARYNFYVTHNNQWPIITLNGISS